jgi:hypothetical protein
MLMQMHRYRRHKIRRMLGGPTPLFVLQPSDLML